MSSRKDRKDFSVVFIPTWRCNCTCEHCFEKILPRTIRPGHWKLFFSKLRTMAETNDIRKLIVYWQGGEVMTMRPSTVARGLEAIAEIFHDTGIAIEHHLQTNLLLYGTQWKDIIADYFVGSISSSIDYPNAYRFTPLIGRDAYTDAWIRKKEEAERDGFIVSVITLPNPATLEVGAEHFFSFFMDTVGVRNVQINFPFPGVNRGKPERLDLDRLGDFLETLYGLWVESGRYLNLNPFMPLEDRLLRDKGTLACAWSYSCANFILAVGPDGEVGQCDCWVSTQKQQTFGTLGKDALDTILASDKRRPFIERPTRLINDPECGRCHFWRICFGGCPIRAYSFTGDIYTKDYYCPVYRRLFAMILNRGGHTHEPRRYPES